MENEVSQGKEGEQRHVVCNQHGADEGYVYEGKDCNSRISEFTDNSLCQGVEKSDVSKGAYNRQHREQACQGLEVEIAKVFLVGRNDYRGDDCRQNGYHQHCVVL